MVIGACGHAPIIADSRRGYNEVGRHPGQRSRMALASAVPLCSVLARTRTSPAGAEAFSCVRLARRHGHRTSRANGAAEHIEHLDAYHVGLGQSSVRSRSVPAWTGLPPVTLSASAVDANGGWSRRPRRSLGRSADQSHRRRRPPTCAPARRRPCRSCSWASRRRPRPASHSASGAQGGRAAFRCRWNADPLIAVEPSARAGELTFEPAAGIGSGTQLPSACSRTSHRNRCVWSAEKIGDLESRQSILRECECSRSEIAGGRSH